jgi:O-antigen/teichoic acid export membrane protein
MIVGTKQLATNIMGQPGLEMAYMIGIGNIWVTSVFYLVQNQLRWELRSRDYAIVSLLMSLTTGGCSVLFVAVFKLGLSGLLIAMVVGTVAATFVGLILLRSSFKLIFNVDHLKDMLGFSVPLVFSGIAVWLSLYVDRILINHFLSIADVGLYGAGYRIASISSLLVIGFQGALTPLVYANYNNESTPRQVEQIFRLFVFMALTACIGLTLFADELMNLLTTSLYQKSASLVVFLTPAIILGSMYIFALGIGIAKKTKILVWINVAGGLLNAALNYVLIPQLGTSGAGIATLLSYAFVFTASMSFSQRHYKVPHNWRVLLSCTVVALLLILFGLKLNSFTKVHFTTNLLVISLFIAVSIRSNLVKWNEVNQASEILIGYIRHKPPSVDSD